MKYWINVSKKNDIQAVKCIKGIEDLLDWTSIYINIEQNIFIWTQMVVLCNTSLCFVSLIITALPLESLTIKNIIFGWILVTFLHEAYYKLIIGYDDQHIFNDP